MQRDENVLSIEFPLACKIASAPWGHLSKQNAVGPRSTKAKLTSL